jgi:uncharacterized protein (DUF2267 family)
MGVADLTAIARSLQKSDVWLNEVQQKLGTNDEQLAYKGLRAFLITLRDRLTTDESADLAAQLPLLLRGLYFEGYKPSRQPDTYRESEDFLQRLEEFADLSGDTEASLVAEACASTAREQLTEGAFDDAIQQLPQSVRKLLGS